MRDLPLDQAYRGIFGGQADAMDAAIGAAREARPAVSAILADHSFLVGPDQSRTYAQLLLTDDDMGWPPLWDELRGGYAGKAIALATTIVLAEPELAGNAVQVAIRVGFGLDRENRVLRDRLFGPHGGHLDLDRFGPHLPELNIDFDEVFQRSCLLGVMHALSDFGRAAATVPRDRPGAVIDAVLPARGCAGDRVDITGSGFGATQPPRTTLTFAGYTGGRVLAPVAAADWSDTHIRVRAPANVGNGTVAVTSEPADSGTGHTVAFEAGRLAGEAVACLGRAAFGFAHRLTELGPRLDAPHVAENPAARFAGGPPKILFFQGNEAVRATLRPRGPLTLRWQTDNADTVTIQTAGPPELPVAPSPVGAGGEHRFPVVNATSGWTGGYVLTATNRCGSVQQRVDVEMRERKALVLAGGGSKGAFEVGAVRCLYDVFHYRPDLICGTSVGALNAAKLAEGPTGLGGLEALWAGMQSSADLYVPTAVVDRLINNLAQLGVKYLAGIDIAYLLGVRLANDSWLSADAELAIGVGKNVLGLVSGAGTLFTVTDIIFAAARAGLLLGKIKMDLEKLFAAPSIFLFTPVRDKIDAAIDPAKIAASGLELRVATVNLDDGAARYVDERGRFVHNGAPVDLRDALQASASIPIAYPPMLLPGGNYVDGGVRDNAPLASADLAGASDITAVLPSPVAMTPHSYALAAFPAVAARSFEALFDETWQNDLAPFRGYHVPVRVIAPSVETHSMLKVDPGLVQIDRDHGWMRAYDETQTDDAVRPRLRALSKLIVTKRLEVWGAWEHRSEGEMLDEQRAGFLSVGLQPTPSADALAGVRRLKLEIRDHCLERQTLVKDALANPPAIEASWQTWEKHTPTWSWTIVTPWEASYAHVGPPLPKVPTPGPLPPP